MLRSCFETSFVFLLGSFPSLLVLEPVCSFVGRVMLHVFACGCWAFWRFAPKQGFAWRSSGCGVRTVFVYCTLYTNSMQTDDGSLVRRSMAT